MTTNVSYWSKVAIAFQSAIGAGQVISGITKANPGVATYVGTDPANGDYLLISAVGMTEIDGRIFRVANVNTGGNTLELEGENTTSYGTFTSGSLFPLTFGNALTTITNFQASGGDFKFEDLTTIHDDQSKQAPTVANPLTFSLESFWDVADANLIALKAASDTKSTRAFRFTFANGQKLLFNGYVGCTLTPAGQAQGKATTPIAVTAFGRTTVYAT